MPKRTPGRVRIVAGIRFRSRPDGHYYSEDGKFVIYHVFRDTRQSAWELVGISKDGGGKSVERELHNEVWLDLLAVSFYTKNAIERFLKTV